MFITVRFGDDRQHLFNANCRTRVLYENIKERCECQEEDVIDLADENGSLKNIAERPQWQYATEFLPNRGSFILLKIKKSEDGTGKEFKTYKPMLTGLLESNPDFMSKIYNKKINPDVAGPTLRAALSPKPPTRGKASTRSQTKASTPSSGRINVTGPKGRTSSRHH